MEKIGGLGGTRTPDALLRTEALYPLSYEAAVASGVRSGWAGGTDRRSPVYRWRADPTYEGVFCGLPVRSASSYFFISLSIPARVTGSNFIAFAPAAYSL